MFGVGGQVRFDGRIIVEGAVEQSSKTGERVFVSEGEVFKLGMRDTVTVTPVSFTALYRQPGRRVAFYGGGGIGQYFYKEDSEFAEPGENISERFTSYHVVFGAEFGGLTPILKAAIEVQFTSVADALGTSGASAAFNENNLGGIQLRVENSWPGGSQRARAPLRRDAAPRLDRAATPGGQAGPSHRAPPAAAPQPPPPG